jgi:type II secretory pathway component PulM
MSDPLDRPAQDRLAKLLRETYRVPPGTDVDRLWPGVRARSQRRAPGWRKSVAWSLAAALMLAVGLTLFWRPPDEAREPLVAEQAFAPVLARLTREIESMRGTVPVETLASLEGLRRETEQAVSDTRRAIREHPEREELYLAEVEILLLRQQETLEFALSVSAARP